VFVIQRSGKWRISEHECVLLFVARVFLGKRILVANVWILDSMKQHVHAADTKHRRIEIKSTEELLIEVMTQFIVRQNLRMMFTEIFARRYQKPGSATGRIADDVARLRRDHFNHHLDYVARRAELSV